MKETNHDYQNCVAGNYHDSNCNGYFSSWSEFKSTFAGFDSEGFDDTYHFVFRYDINETSTNLYELKLCILLQRKGIYVHIAIDNIPKELLNTEINQWLKERFSYMGKLWGEVLNA